MPYAAITYNVQPGHEDEIAAVFAAFRRVDTPVLRDEEGRVSGRLLGTAVFIDDATLVRFIHYEGSLEDVGRHMARQAGVHELEEKLKPYLAAPRDTGTEDGFRNHFSASLMRCIAQLSAEPAEETRA
ncbi:SchA/CurD-like domain-containing protein [Microbispora siamensis]